METPIRHILVHLDGGPGAAERLACGRRLSLEHAAHLSVLFASTPALRLVPYPGAAGPWVASVLVDQDGERRAGARNAYEQELLQPGLQATWSELYDPGATSRFSACAVYADLLVLGQADPGASPTGGVPSDFVQAVLSASGRPAVVVPHAGAHDRPFRTIAVAWKETPQAVHALVAALPLLRAAGQVHVLAWGWPRPLVHGPRFSLPEWLHAHGVEAQWHVEPTEPPDIGDVLLSRCAELGADLLVMGCYGHARAREWFLGGASRTVLQSMSLRVLMAH